MSLLDKIRKNTIIPEAAVISKSKIWDNKSVVSTNVPMLNVALDGKFAGGLHSGLIQITGKSKHFKSKFALEIAAAFQRKFPDGIVLFYDTEFGSPKEYFDSSSVDIDRVFHVPVKNIEEFKVDIVKQLENFSREDNVIIIVDSIGNMASLKEIEDALKEDVKADVGRRAKDFKSISRIVTPYLALKDIPMVIINHVYDELGLFPKQIVGGGTGWYLAADEIWIINRSQIKDSDKEIIGWDFNINIEKSRFIREKSVIPITVTYEKGIDKYSGFFELAKELGFLTSPKKGKFVLRGDESEEYTQKEMTDEFWERFLTKFPDFIKKVEDSYKL